MSKELMKVKEDGVKSKLFDFAIIFICIIIGIGIIFISFYISYNKIIKDEENQNEYIAQDKEQNSEEQVEQNDDEQVDEENEKQVEEDEIVAPSNDIKESQENNLESEETINEKLPLWTDTAIQDIKNIYSSDEKQVYLTFDDGPSKEVTPQILDILKVEDVPATFFVLGKCVDSNPDLVKQEYESGHFIANHGYTHTYSQIYASIDNVINEYNQTNESIKRAINNENYDCHLFRFPGGSSGGPYDSLKSQAKQYLAENQIASTNWNCLTSDAAGNYTVDSQYQGALETQGNKTSLIILMHDAADKKATPETLKLLIKHYKEEGYTFKNFYSIFSQKEEEPTM